MKSIPYGKQSIDDSDINSVVEVLKSDFLTQGPKVKEFEDAICAYTGADYCVAVANGTAALHLAVAALNLEKGSEGITSPITFVASANAIVYSGLIPVFADIDKDTANIDPSCIKKAITKKTSLIIPVHFAGLPVNMKLVSEIAQSAEISVIEDAAHAIGSEYEDGSKVGNCKYSDMTTFSFHPVKTITSGEGGAITTNNEELYKRLLKLRTHGITKENMSENPGPWYYEMQELGFNYRLTDIHAALGISQLKKLDRFALRRREIVKAYNIAFSDVEELMPLNTRVDGVAYHLYVLLIDFDKIGCSRTELMALLEEKGIKTQVHYIPVCNQPYYQKNYKIEQEQYVESQEFYNKSLSLPLYPTMTDDDVAVVIKTLLEFIKR